MACTPIILDRAGSRLGIIGVTDHPPAYAALPDRAGVAYADLRRGSPRWLLHSIRDLDAIVSPHWGPNMVAELVDHVREAAGAFRGAGATLVAGHSAHVFHGVGDAVIYDLGDFIDDYATDPELRNDLGLLFLVTFEHRQPTLLEAVPLALDYCHTRLADTAEASWIYKRLRQANAGFGTETFEPRGRLVVEWDSAHNLPPPTSSAAGHASESSTSANSPADEAPT
jgi:poly-gamma-glutamate synthesis protein (capsule biosynthesis protein)